MKITSVGATVRFESGQSRLTLGLASAAVVLTVEDDGIGLHVETPCAFDRPSLAGLGLPSMRERAEELGGRVSFRRCCVDGSRAGGEGFEVKRRRRPPTSPVELSAFAGFRFPPDVIMLAVRWYPASGCRTAISRSSLRSAASMSITSPCTGGCNGSRRC